MTTIYPRWRKSIRSGQATNCVEVRYDLGAIQDTKHRGPKVTGDIRALVAAIRADQIG